MDLFVNNSPVISIIVPVFNAEKYIRRCINSLLAQTFKSFELILVDDGSTDKCPQICDEYAENDKRIRVIHKNNGGVATARQTGIDVAVGEYIIYADPDDWTDPEMLEQMYNKAKDTDADVVICDFYSTDAAGKDTLHAQKPISSDPHSILKDIVLFHRLHGSLWNKLAKRACYIKYELHFMPCINYCEDVLIWVQLFQHNEVKTAYLNKAFYHYFQGNSGSITHSTKPEIIETMSRYYDKLEEILPPEDKYISDAEWIKYYFWLWKNHHLSSMGFRCKNIHNRTIANLHMHKKDKVACLLLNNGFGNTARLLMKVKKP